LGVAASYPTAKTTLPGSATNTSKVPATITSCGSVDWNTYLAPSLQSLPSASLEAYLVSGYSKLNRDFANLERYQNSNITDTAALVSFLFAEISTVNADVTSLYGSAGWGIVSFQNIASTDPCLFSACLTSYLAVSSAIAPRLSGLFDFEYKAAPPCCGQCTVLATGVQLKYWPTPAPTPPVSILVDRQNVS
jgi:hypothetical protein